MYLKHLKWKVFTYYEFLYLNRNLILLIYYQSHILLLKIRKAFQERSDSVINPHERMCIKSITD
jgi:hypothetical protein